jgi:hypothetical protein
MDMKKVAVARVSGFAATFGLDSRAQLRVPVLSDAL